MCGGNALVPAETYDMLLNYTATDFIPGAPEGQIMGCGSMESYLHTISESDPMCTEISEASAEMCQCPEDTGESDTGPDDGTEAPAEPSAAPGSMIQAAFWAMVGGMMTVALTMM